MRCKRPFRRVSLRVAIITAACAALHLGAAVRAHEFFVSASLGSVLPGSAVTLAMSLREDQVATSTQPPLVPGELDVRVAGPSTDTVVLNEVALDPDGRLKATFNAPEAPALYTIGAAMESRTMTYAAQDFQNYLLREGLGSALAFRRTLSEESKPAREVATMNAKAFVRVGRAIPARPDEPRRFGWNFELVPLGDPTALRVGDTLHVRTYHFRLPIGRVQVSAKRLEATPGELPATGLTSSVGDAQVTLSRPGRWLIRAAHMIPRSAPGGGETRWQSYWASLTIDVKPR